MLGLGSKAAAEQNPRPLVNYISCEPDCLLHIVVALLVASVINREGPGEERFLMF